MLQKRADFLACAKGAKAGGALIGLQGRRRGVDDRCQHIGSRENALRVGFTASKKVGNAVHRNRAKRRMRALARALLPELGVPACDYVFVARAETVRAPWASLVDEARSGLIKLRRHLLAAARSQLRAPSPPGAVSPSSEAPARPEGGSSQ